MRLTTTLTLLLVAIAMARAEAPSVQGTMPEDYLPGLAPLLKEAVERSPSTLAANISVAVAEANRYQNAAALWPTVSLSSDYAVTKESLSAGPSSTSKGLFYSGNISQNIFEWGAVKNQAQIGRIAEQVAERRFGDAYRQLAETIRVQYMALIQEKITIRNERFKQKMSENALAAQQVRFDAGSSSQAELSGFKLQLEEQKLSTDRVEEDFDYAKQVFIRLVGIDSLGDDSIPLEIPHPEFKAALADAVLMGFVGGGVESTFQNEVYKLTIKQDDLNYKIAKVRLLPKFFGQAGYSYSNYSSVSTGNITQLGVQQENYSIVGSWTIFDGLATKGAKLGALAAKRQDELQRKLYVDTSIDTIASMRRELGFSSRSMAFAELHEELIAAEVRRLGDDKALGYASQASVDAGVLTLETAQFNMAYARSEYLRHWVDFISLAGIDPAEDNVPTRYGR